MNQRLEHLVNCLLRNIDETTYEECYSRDVAAINDMLSYRDTAMKPVMERSQAIEAYHCPRCHTILQNSTVHFCPACGQFLNH